jgi:hypothetical protein
MPCFVSHLEAAIDGTQLPAGQLQTLHKDRPLWVRYDLPAVGRAMSKQALRDREPTMWRYRELLPVDDDQPIVSLGEGMSPLLACPRLGARLGVGDLWIKDESQLPTGSFKSRGMAMAITMAHGFGVRRVAVPSAGNAGGAAAAYAARAGIEAFVFMPEDTPVINQYECLIAGAKTFVANGLITDCGRIVREGSQRMGWFDLSTLKEPYRIEGKKTMGLELAEQFDWLASARCDPVPHGRRHGADRHVEGLRRTGPDRLAGKRPPPADDLGAIGRLLPDRAGFRAGRAICGTLPAAGNDRPRPARAGRRRRLHDPGRGPRKRRLRDRGRRGAAP